MYKHDVFRPGYNCWRVERAGSVAFLVDGEAYFRAFHAAVGLAQRFILIVGWDIDSRTRLVRDALPDDVPVTLFDCLAAAVTRHHGCTPTSSTGTTPRCTRSAGNSLS